MQSSRGVGVSWSLTRLRRIVTGRIEEGADLRLVSRWRIGGSAAALVEPASAVEARGTLAVLAEDCTPALVVGNGSNLLFDDAGFDGVIVRIGRSLGSISRDGRTVRAEAGLFAPRFVRELGRFGLSGLEHAIGIPGTLGGLIYMNGGSQRKGVGSNIVAVRGCDRSGRAFERSHAECGFHYRGSSLQSDDLVVLEADFAFVERDPASMRREMIAILADRQRKFPKNLPNCGSVFLSDPLMYRTVGPPGAAIERVGLKGTRLGGAEISTLHANFIVNVAGASSRDVLGLIHLARTRVHDATGFWMDCEVRHVAPDGRLRPAHEAAAETAVSRPRAAEAAS
ncbi:UDP-N-acetylmuramate dehydrogenase [Methylosinus sp. PW1]|uniref:UDP-N-acetylmuramate dehydrogenase n=1 Tax=Methylosinus sp. PW1 TaxID=107636 RepID=UPI0009FD9DC5|nr:UDP-N-acetylmuramate dehydrogenase [Methylosinus sp. PW1]